MYCIKEANTSLSVKYTSQVRYKPVMFAISVLAGNSGRDRDAPGQGGGGDVLAACFCKASTDAFWIQLTDRDRFSLLKKAN